MLQPGRYKVFIASTAGLVVILLTFIVGVLAWNFIASKMALSSFPPHSHPKDQEIADLQKEVKWQNEVIKVFIKRNEDRDNKIAELKRIQDWQDSWIKQSQHDMELDHNHLLLLATLLNENLASLNSNNITYVERDWSIRKMPQYLDLSSEDINWLQQFVKVVPAPALRQIPK